MCVPILTCAAPEQPLHICGCQLCFKWPSTQICKPTQNTDISEIFSSKDPVFLSVFPLRLDKSKQLYPPPASEPQRRCKLSHKFRCRFEVKSLEAKCLLPVDGNQVFVADSHPWFLQHVSDHWCQMYYQQKTHATNYLNF